MSSHRSSVLDQASFPAPRVLPSAAHAFGGIFRLTVRRFFTPGHWLALLGMFAVLALFASAPNFNRYLRWAGLFYVCFLVPILAFIAAAGVARDDLKAGSVDYIFTRPIRRSLFIVFRFLSHVACAQLEFALALLVVLTVGTVRDVPGIWGAATGLLWVQMLVVITFSAFGFFCGMITSRYVIVGLLYGGIVEVGVGSIPTQLNRISVLRHAVELLQPVIGNIRMGMGGPAVAPAMSAPAAVALLLAISAVLLAATAAVFTTRELVGAAARDT